MKKLLVYTFLTLSLFLISCERERKHPVVSILEHYESMPYSEDELSDSLFYEDDLWESFLDIERSEQDSIFNIYEYQSYQVYVALQNPTEWDRAMRNFEIVEKSLINWPKIDKILKRALKVDNEVISEEKHPRAKSGLASCTGNQRKIYFTDRINPYTASLSYVFFREHEYAHHKLGHVSCSSSKDQSSKEKEFAADCEAVKTLLKFGVEGRRIVDVAAGTFIGLNKDSQDHGHSMERALNLFQCAQE